MSRRSTVLFVSLLLASFFVVERTHEFRATSVEPVQEPAAPARARRAVPVVRRVDFGVELSEEESLRPFVNGFATVEQAFTPPKRLVDLRTVRETPFPPFGAAPGGSTTLHAYPDGQATVAIHHDREHGRLGFELLTVDTMRWEPAGEFDYPAEEHTRISARPLLYEADMVDDGLGDAGMTQLGMTFRRIGVGGPAETFVLDRDTATWHPVTVEWAPAECAIHCAGDDRDLIRWGINHTTDEDGCASVRRSAKDPWVSLPDHGGLVDRACRWLDDRYAVAWGGTVGYQLFPTIGARFDLIDVETATVRVLSRDGLWGIPLEAPGPDAVWVSDTTIVRLDRRTHALSTEPLPDLGFAPTWQRVVLIDPGTLLFVAPGARPSAAATVQMVLEP